MTKIHNKTASTVCLALITLFFLTVWANSIIGTTDLVNWLIENTLMLITLLFLISTYRNYRFSNFSYLLICIFLCLHVYGSKYTYAENSFGFWLQDVFNSPRNQYGRLVHFSFGFLLYYPMKKCFSNFMKYSERFTILLPITVVLSVSAIYEIIEWIVADVFFVKEGVAYLGKQGDI
jgi:putative membrane protein